MFHKKVVNGLALKLNRLVLLSAEAVAMIQVEHLTRVFGEFTAVHNISFEVGKGEIFAFLGPNGAGKTTTIKMLTTLLQPTSGKIWLDGLDPTVKQHQTRKSFWHCLSGPEPGWGYDWLRES